MHPKFRVLPYKFGSHSAKTLSEVLGGKLLKLNNSSFVPSPNDVIINWGNRLQSSRCTINGNMTAMTLASNKLWFFQHFAGEPYVPEFWTRKEDIPDEAFPVVCRTVLTGHSGAGIVLADVRSQLVSAPLYVRYVPKQDEFRVHVGLTPDGNTTTISVQQKKRRLDHDQPNWKIRNHANGFIYAREGVDPPARVIDAAHAALVHVGLDFGAVDVIWNDKQGKAYVLEINTAPGIEGQTVDDYANYFRGFASRPHQVYPIEG
jgi:hypothetical protein